MISRAAARSHAEPRGSAYQDLVGDPTWVSGITALRANRHITGVQAIFRWGPLRRTDQIIF